jgi:hypothetical protein
VYDLHRMHTRWYFLVTLVKCKLVSVHLEIVLISTQDRCTVCTTIGSEIILMQLMVLLCDMGQVESHFGPYGDTVNLNAR